MNSIPKFILIKQNNEAAPAVPDKAAAARNALEALGLTEDRFSGKTVGITGGSRGIDGIEIVLREVCSFVKEKGGTPVVFAAMGSHGGGTAEGQREVLASLSITEETVGAEIKTCGDSKYYGETGSGYPVYGNILADTFDELVVVNRIKMHTDFEGDTESGLLKMLAIGVGNPMGCDNVHNLALQHGYAPVLQDVGGFLLKRLNVAFGLAVTENWQHKMDSIEAIMPEDVLEAEKRILARVKAGSVKLPVKAADALIIDMIGKDISGTGMDTKVVGRIRVFGQPEPEYPKIGRIAVLGLTEGSHGNAIGIGLADYTTKAVFDSIDIPATSLNAVSSNCPEQGCLPCIVADDYEAVRAAVGTTGLEDPTRAKAVFIQDTNHLEYIAVSEALYEDLKENPEIEAVSDFFELEFGEGGILKNRWSGGTLAI